MLICAYAVEVAVICAYIFNMRIIRILLYAVYADMRMSFPYSVYVCAYPSKPTSLVFYSSLIFNSKLQLYVLQLISTSFRKIRELHPGKVKVCHGAIFSQKQNLVQFLCRNTEAMVSGFRESKIISSDQTDTSI